jgi:hypothetical protein
MLAVAVGVALVWCTNVSAQSPPPDQPSEKVVSVAFGGGTLAEYVATLRGEVGTVNIVLSNDEVGSIRLPAINLESVTLDSAVGLLESEVWPGDKHLWVHVEKLGASTGPKANPVYRISTHRQGGASVPEVRVWSVAGLMTQGVAAEEVLTAVESSVELLAGEVPAAEVRFHDATGLVIARGHDEQLAAIDRVVDGLRRTVHERYEAKRDRGSEKLVAELQDVLKQREMEVRDLRMELETALIKRERLQQENDELHAMVQECRRAELAQ